MFFYRFGAVISHFENELWLADGLEEKKRWRMREEPDIAVCGYVCVFIREKFTSTSCILFPQNDPKAQYSEDRSLHVTSTTREGIVMEMWS